MTQPALSNYKVIQIKINLKKYRLTAKNITTIKIKIKTLHLEIQKKFW